MFIKFLISALFILATAFSLVAQSTSPTPKTAVDPDEKDAPAKPAADISDGKYGEFAANTFDLWKARSKKATGLVVYIHGGGLASGDKSKLSVNQLNSLLKAGLSVMAINYRLTGEAVFPQHYMDCVRAIQYARYHAKDWNLDPSKVALTGSSAGGMTSLWIAFHDDMADPKNVDPVLRESSRVKVAAVFSAQTTLEQSVVEKYVGKIGTQYKSYYSGKMFGKTPAEMATPEGLELYKAISPLHYLTKDDPPVWAIYSITDKPLTDTSTTSDAIHHPGFGKVLKEEMDKLKIECKLRHKDDGKNINGDMVDFIVKYINK